MEIKKKSNWTLFSYLYSSANDLSVLNPFTLRKTISPFCWYLLSIHHLIYCHAAYCKPLLRF